MVKKILLGNFKGPKGNTGPTGPKGDKQGIVKRGVDGNNPRLEQIRSLVVV